MTVNQKKYLLILIVLLAVIGLVGAGCLGNNADNNTSNATNNTSNATNNTNNTPNASVNTTPAPSNNTSNTTNNSSQFSNVVYANQSNGSGGSRRPSAPAFSAVLNITEPAMNVALVMSDTMQDANITNLVIDVPSANLVGNTVQLTMTSSVSSSNITAVDSSIDEANISVSGRVITIPFASIPSEASLETSLMTITIGQKVYQVSFNEAAYFLSTVGPSGTMEINEMTAPRNGTVVVDEIDKPVDFTFTPSSGYVRTGFNLTKFGSADDAGAQPYNAYGYRFSSVESAIYNVSVSFEQKATATIGNEDKWYIDQNLNAENNIYLYIPASQIVAANTGDAMPIVISLPNATFTGISKNISNAQTAIVNGAVQIILTSVDNLENGGVGSPSRITVTAQAGDETYNIYLLKSAKVTFKDAMTIGEGPNSESVSAGESGVMDIGPVTFTTTAGNYIQYQINGGELQYIEDHGVLELTDNTYVFSITQQGPPA